MSETGEGQSPALAALRARIDAIDEAMHRLLMERGEVIDSLIRIKGTSLPGAAFRPAREADMMRRLVARHHGALPLTTVEHIWRAIITTFTKMQAPFALAIEGGSAAEALRDLARFYFGFSVEIAVSRDAAAAVERIAATGTDLGLLALAPKPGAGIWWRGLGGPGRPQVMALLPFIRLAGRPADTPAFVVSPPLAEAGAGDVKVLAARFVEGMPANLPRAASARLLVEAEEGGIREALFAMPATMSPGEFAALADTAGMRLDEFRQLGSIAAGISVGASDLPLYRSMAPTGLPA